MRQSLVFLGWKNGYDLGKIILGGQYRLFYVPNFLAGETLIPGEWGDG